MRDESQFFKGLGARIKGLREEAGESQEDMLSHGYSVRYWQKVEAGKPDNFAHAATYLSHIFNANV